MIYRCANPEVFEALEKPDFKQYSGKLMLWGAGKLGSVAAYVLKQRGIEFVAFVDSSPEKWGTEFCGHKIISPDELAKSRSDAIVIATNIFRRDVMPWLAERGILGFDAWPLLLEFDWSGYDYMNELYMSRMVDYYFTILVRDFKLKKKYFVDSLYVEITSRCSLRCEECCAFVPYNSNPRDFDKEETTAYAMTVIEAIGQFRELSLTGGEPLLHKDLADLIRAFRDIDAFEVINILTNGTILPTEDVIEAMKNEPRMLVRISDYGVISHKSNEIAKLLTENNIKTEIIDYKNWYKRPSIGVLDYTIDDLCHKFNACMSACFPHLSNGRIYYCLPSMTLCEIGVFPNAKSNYLELSSIKGSQFEKISTIHEYISRMDRDDYYIDACKYCSGKVSTEIKNLVPPAVQAKGKLKLEKIVQKFDEVIV
jgi:organic radical activating enzyme